MAKKGQTRMVEKLNSSAGGLLVSELESTHPSGQSQMLSVADIDPDPKQPRQFFDEDDMAELERSVAEKGEVVQPIAVRPVGKRYMIIWGERRWRSAKKIGVKKVPVLIRNVSAEDALELALVENVPRSSLTALELADGLVRLMEAKSYGKAEAGARLGMSPTATSKHLKVAALEPTVKKLLSGTRVPLDQLYAIAQVADLDAQLSMARKVVGGRSSREETRALAKGGKSVDQDSVQVAKFTVRCKKVQLSKKSNEQRATLQKRLIEARSEIARLLKDLRSLD